MLLSDGSCIFKDVFSSINFCNILNSDKGYSIFNDYLFLLFFGHLAINSALNSTFENVWEHNLSHVRLQNSARHWKSTEWRSVSQGKTAAINLFLNWLVGTSLQIWSSFALDDFESKVSSKNKTDFFAWNTSVKSVICFLFECTDWILFCQIVE